MNHTQPVQEQGLLGRMVGGMIRRSVIKSFHTVYWKPPLAPLEAPVVFLCSHHSWHDGYLMFLAVSKLGIPTLDWIAEYDAFPLFAKVGGLPYPPNDPARRAGTARRTIRMLQEGWSLILFADGVLRRPDEPWEVGTAAPLIARQVPHAALVPVAIRCQLSMHQRPEAFLEFGEPLPWMDARADRGAAIRQEAKARLSAMLSSPIGVLSDWQVLQNGTLDVNERWDMRRIPGRRIE